VTDPNDNRPPEDADLSRVLRAIGPRDPPPEDVTRAVHQAVHAEWRAVVDAERAKRRRRFRFRLTVAASIVLVAAAVWLGASSREKPAVEAASIARLTGDVKADGGLWSMAGAVSERQILYSGYDVITGSTGRVALVFGRTVSVRLDRTTEIELMAPDRVRVRAGAVYVDAQPGENRGSRLMIDTPAGVVAHLGTQYEVRLVGSAVRIRVREGAITLAQHDGTTQGGQAGEQLTIAPDGRVERAPMPPYGREWDWVSETAPAFVMGDRPLSQFLAWAARELGQEIVYATPESAAEAERARLSGAVENLSPQDLPAVLTTTRLRSAERNGQLVIDFERHGIH
jgi:ferric-dicitrate binding protein FerR (iron transport regulator)